MLVYKKCQTIVPQFELRNSAGDMIIVPDTLLFLEVVFFTSLRAVSMPSKKKTTARLKLQTLRIDSYFGNF